MKAKVLAVMTAAAAAAGVMAGIPWASAGTSAHRGHEPVLNPGDFVRVISNPYFPLPVGRTLVYRGIRDGQTQEDRVTVTNRTKVVAEGITARVVTDVATAQDGT